MRLMDWPSNSMASSGRGSSATTPDLARLGDVTRVRMIQTMNLLNHAPDIREEILFLPRTAAGRDPVSDRRLRHLAAVGPMGPAAETPTGGL